MNRPHAASLAQSIREHAEIAEAFLRGPMEDERRLELEVLGRCNLIEAKLAQLRAEVMRKQSGRPEFSASEVHHHYHVLGDRPSGDAA